MTRRVFLHLCALAALAQKRESVRGRLIQEEGKPPRIRAADGMVIELEGDAATVAVLFDQRLKTEDFEALGEFKGPDRFAVLPIHERALFVWRMGRKLVITYWCEVCAIRSYSPGPCQCCQEWTALDPRDPALKDTDPAR
jgi:hypothetical protein